VKIAIRVVEKYVKDTVQWGLSGFRKFSANRSCTSEDAYRCFMASDMDVLVLENCVLRKSEQPKQDESERSKYVESFQLD